MHAETMTRTLGLGLRGQWALAAFTAVLALLATLKLGSADVPAPIPATFAFSPARSAAAQATFAPWAGPWSWGGLGDLNMVHADVPTDSGRGTQLAVLTLVFGGIPAALVAIACAAARGTATGSWDQRWHTPFLLGLLFQAYAVAVSIIPTLLLIAIDPLESLALTASLALSVLAGGVALPRWRRLQLAAVGTTHLR